MYWILLIGGVAAMGEPGKGAVAAAIAASSVLMIIGYRGTDFVPVWQPPSFMVHINNLGMLIAIYMLSPAPKRGKLLAGMRHPMLTGFSIWAGVPPITAHRPAAAMAAALPTSAWHPASAPEIEALNFTSPPMAAAVSRKSSTWLSDAPGTWAR